MNSKNRAKSSSLFLLELILAILFFSIASAVCVQIFVKSHLLNKQAQALNMAVTECSGMAELMTGQKDAAHIRGLIKRLYPHAVISEDGTSVQIYYDKDMQLCDSDTGIYCMTMLLSSQESMLTAHISMQDLQQDTCVYELSVHHHIPMEVAHET